jgi:carbonic anhydrase
MSRHPVSYTEALERLRAGNARFAHNVLSIDSLGNQSRRELLLAGQEPFACILSCSDSRAPSEMVFDCGLGDLFVVRVAGNVVAPSIVGSVEFAASTFGTELVVVMGHTRCGAIKSTVDTITKGKRSPSSNVQDIVERIMPAVSELVDDGQEATPALMRDAMRANVRASANHLRHGSRLLEKRIVEGRLRVVGAEYELETGLISFFDGVPEPEPT